MIFNHHLREPVEAAVQSMWKSEAVASPKPESCHLDKLNWKKAPCPVAGSGRKMPSRTQSPAGCTAARHSHLTKGAAEAKERWNSSLSYLFSSLQCMITSSSGFHRITLGGLFFFFFFKILILKALEVFWSMEHKILRRPEKNQDLQPGWRFGKTFWDSCPHTRLPGAQKRRVWLSMPTCQEMGNF